MNIGNCYDIMGLTDKAIVHYKLALKLAPDYYLAHYNIGVAYEKKGLIDDAIMHYKRALEIEPTFIEAQQRLKNVDLRR